MTITQKDLQKLAEEKLRDALVTPSLLGERLKEVFDFAVANDAALDDGAKAYLDKVYDGLATAYEQGLCRSGRQPGQKEDAPARGGNETEAPPCGELLEGIR